MCLYELGCLSLDGRCWWRLIHCNQVSLRFSYCAECEVIDMQRRFIRHVFEHMSENGETLLTHQSQHFIIMLGRSGTVGLDAGINRSFIARQPSCIHTSSRPLCHYQQIYLSSFKKNPLILISCFSSSALWHVKVLIEMQDEDFGLKSSPGQTSHHDVSSI